MMFGWKPKLVVSGAPIPLYYNYETFEIPPDAMSKQPPRLHPPTSPPSSFYHAEIYYYGFRPADSLIMHREFARPELGGYLFKFPPTE